jgi:hypothetical protein
VVDYATKLCLAATLVPTNAARDAIEVLRGALAAALLGRPLRDDRMDARTASSLR